MDPISSPISNLSAVVQALLLRQGMQPAEVEALLQAVGQELSVLFLGQGAAGARLELPTGQIVTAQGELPFPEGTQLRVRVETESGGLKLLTLEARPPAPPSLLAPLLQGEATALTARLTEVSPAPELGPLVQLLRTLGGMPEPASTVALPSQDVLVSALAALPKELAASLARALGSADAAPETLATGLSAVLKDVAASREAASNPQNGRLQLSAAGELLARFQGLLQRADLPPEHASALDGWIRGLLARKSQDAAPPAHAPAETPRPSPLRAAADSRILSQGEVLRAAEAMKAHGGPAVQVPEAWEAWIKGTVRTLADPALSPREAPFHALQAKEGTAFFEIPLPWAGGKPLQLWVEDDAPENRPPEAEETRRVLLALHLTQLGETRVSLQMTGNALSVRIWTEHPERVEALHGEIERELGESGKAVDLRVMTLGTSGEDRVPDLRSLAMGSSLHALG